MGTGANRQEGIAPACQQKAFIIALHIAHEDETAATAKVA